MNVTNIHDNWPLLSKRYPDLTAVSLAYTATVKSPQGQPLFKPHYFYAARKHSKTFFCHLGDFPVPLLTCNISVMLSSALHLGGANRQNNHTISAAFCQHGVPPWQCSAAVNHHVSLVKKKISILAENPAFLLPFR